ncbi:MAG: nicotinate-nucleotide adenylyltransferase [Candidatus Omnitrophica bacterium]|nr:nicotinate-nucleotide adenylyltransferase [Candidatus Omnitrophota bacterium]
MNKIGILGGTFNPVHVGHLAVADYAIEKLGLNKVIFVPSALPPHKSAKGVIEAHHRYEMLKIAAGENPKFEVCDFEIKQGGKSYSVDTVKYLISQYPAKTKFYFIIGEDNYAGLAKWRNIDELMALTEFVVVSRPESAPCRSDGKARFLKMPGLEVSSTYIRKNIAQRTSIRYLIPAEVLQYIKAHKLYLS